MHYRPVPNTSTSPRHNDPAGCLICKLKGCQFCCKGFLGGDVVELEITASTLWAQEHGFPVGRHVFVGTTTYTALQAPRILWTTLSMPDRRAMVTMWLSPAGLLLKRTLQSMYATSPPTP